MDVQLKRLEGVPLNVVLKVYLISNLQGLFHGLHILAGESITEPNSSAVKVICHHELKAAEVVEPSDNYYTYSTQSTEYTTDLG